MASRTGVVHHWETVGKHSKKSKSNGQSLTKNQKKNFQDSMPRIEKADPVKEDPTIYSAFVEKEERSQQVQQSRVKQVASGGDVKKSPQSSNKRKKQSEKPTSQSLDDAFALIQAGELETILTKDQTTFPDSPAVWLKDLASVLNLKFESVPDNDPVYSEQPPDFPSCKLTKSVRSLLNRTLNECKTATLLLFFDHCVQSMINNMAKNVPTYGYRVFIQLIAYNKPEICVQDMDKNLELLKSNQNRPLRCLSIMWAMGQCGSKNLMNGLKVWVELMVPMLKLRSLSPYAVDYLEKLFEYHSDLKMASDAMTFKDFFPLLDLVFTANSSLPKHLQKKLLALYPKLKTVAFGDKPSETLRLFFPSFLTRAKPDCPPVLKAELMSSLVTCLTTDRHCFSVWRQVYLKQMTQTSVLLDHLNDNWPEMKKKLDLTITKETIRAFSITNEEMTSHGRGQNEGVQECIKSCQQLLDKLERSGFPWGSLLFFLFATLLAVVAYDVYVSATFKGSRTAGILAELGLLPILEHLWSRLGFYGAKLNVWLQENVPYYYTKFVELVGPTLQVIWESLQHACSWLVEMTKTQRAWLAHNVPIWLETVRNHWVYIYCVEKLTLAWVLLQHYCVLWWSHLVAGVQACGTWLQENVFTEKFYTMLGDFVAALQEYMKLFIAKITSLWAAKGTDGVPT